MRVLFIGPHLAKGGGLVLQTFQLFTLLRKSIDATWICLDAPGTHRDLTKRPGVSVVGRLIFPLGIGHLSRATRALRRSYDIFQVVDPYYALPASYLSKVSPRVVMFGTDPRAELRWRFGPVASAIYSAFMPFLLAGTTVVANSESLAHRLSGYRPHIIPNGVDADWITNAPTREEARQMLGIPQDLTILLYVGKVVPVKRLEWLVEIADRFPQIRAVVVGGHREEYYGDRYYRHLLSLFPSARTRVRFVGEVQWEEVLRYLAAADIFVFPSRFEGQPNAVLEAMAAGLPVVASDIPAHRDVIEHGRTGFLAPDLPSMVRQVSQLLLEGELRAQVGEAGRRHVVDNFSFTRAVEQYLALYSSLGA